LIGEVSTDAGREQGADRYHYSDYVNPFFMSPMCALLGSVMLFGGLNALFRFDKCTGLLVAAIGWCLVFMWFVVHSENASASHGSFGASYGRA
jgi:hypothetical protein